LIFESNYRLTVKSLLHRTGKAVSLQQLKTLLDYVLLKDILVGQSGRTTVSRVFQRPERGGYYLGVPLPNELRKKLKKSKVVRKLGTTYKEANI